MAVGCRVHRNSTGDFSQHPSSQRQVMGMLVGQMPIPDVQHNRQLKQTHSHAPNRGPPLPSSGGIAAADQGLSTP